MLSMARFAATVGFATCSLVLASSYEAAAQTASPTPPATNPPPATQAPPGYAPPPSAAQPGYPPPAGYAPPPAAQPSYPPPSGYAPPPAAPPGYPPPSGYAPPPAAQPGYPPPSGYAPPPAAQPGYPPPSGYAPPPAAQPGYPPPSGYAPPPAAQPGYPPPSGYAPPPAAQSGYPPPAGYYPPPATGQPAEGVAPGSVPPATGTAPGYYAPPPAAPAYGSPRPSVAKKKPTDPRFHRGILGMPYLGLQIPVGQYGDLYGTSLRVGGLVGGHVTTDDPKISINAEFTLDWLRVTNAPFDQTAIALDILCSPLLHFDVDRFEIVGGPKLGASSSLAHTSYHSPGYRNASDWGSTFGLAYGFNLGGFIGVGDIAVGGILSFVGRHAFQGCYWGDQPHHCSNVSGSDPKLIGLVGAALF